MAYEFGFGLSYTTFNMSGLNVKDVYGGGIISSNPPSAPVAPGGIPSLWDVLYECQITVTNTGLVGGAAIPQLYLSLPQIPNEDPTPVKVLRGFEKVSLQPNQSTTVNFDLMRRDMSYWSTLQQTWVIPHGNIGIMAGFSSRDISLISSVTVI